MRSEKGKISPMFTPYCDDETSPLSKWVSIPHATDLSLLPQDASNSMYSPKVEVGVEGVACHALASAPECTREFD